MIAALLLAAAVTLSPAADKAPVVTVAEDHPSQTGIKTSKYKGEFFVAALEPYRKCVAWREGRGQYWTTSSNGYYMGTYQFNKPLAAGAVWMITPELRRMYGDKKGRALRDELHATKPTKWNRFYWDMAFWTVLNWEGTGSGANHWKAVKRPCQHLMVGFGG